MKPRPRHPSERAGQPAAWRGLAVTVGLLCGMVAIARADGVASGQIKPDFAALAREAMITLPPPPVLDTSHGSAMWSIEDVKAELAKITDTPPRVNFLRSKLLLPDHAQLVDYKAWFHRLEKPLKLHFVEQLWDCDNYASCFVAFADLLALKSGETRGSLCVGWASVFYRFKFAGIKAGGAHAVVIVGTSKGFFIVEPQDGTMIALREFPNRNTIEEIYF
jgi:hypothetical protein